MGSLFEYALLRIVPRPERGESINADVVLYSPGVGFLDVRVYLDTYRLRALDPGVDPETFRAHLRAVLLVCRGGSEAGSVGLLSPRQRFGRLVAPRSTVVEPSPVHTRLLGRPRDHARTPPERHGASAGW